MRFLFGDCVLDADRRELRRAGEPVAVEPQVFDLLLHCQGDNVVPLDQGRRIAAAIPGARLVVLESDNHVVLPGEPEWPRFCAEVEGSCPGTECGRRGRARTSSGAGRAATCSSWRWHPPPKGAGAAVE